MHECVRRMRARRTCTWEEWRNDEEGRRLARLAKERKLMPCPDAYDLVD